MKRVAIIAPDFTPSSLPPATRVRFFASHLPEFGWEPIIITTKPEFYEAPVDRENEQLLPPALEVVRTDAFPAKWTRKFGVGDVGMRSLWQHWRVLKRLCQEKRIDLVFVPVPPSVPMVLGRLANMRFGVPYVIDYIDPWVTDYYHRLPKSERPPKWRLSDAMSRLLEPFALKRVAHITGVSKGTTDSVVSRYSWLSSANATEIPYGAEEQDFVQLRQHPRSNSIFDPRDGLVHMSYVGACIPSMYPAVRAVFEAVRRGIQRSPQSFSKLRLHFVGTSYAANGEGPQGIIELAREAGIEAQVTEKAGRVAYLESLQVMIDSDALLLVGSEEPHYTASKVFPYILAQRPLLAVFHEESSATKILTETRACAPITFSAERLPAESVTGILTELERLLALPREHQSELDRDALYTYTTPAMSARLAGVFTDAWRTGGESSRSLSSIRAVKKSDPA
jgi:hypothetical protein